MAKEPQRAFAHASGDRFVAGTPGLLDSWSAGFASRPSSAARAVAVERTGNGAG